MTPLSSAPEKVYFLNPFTTSRPMYNVSSEVYKLTCNTNSWPASQTLRGFPGAHKIPNKWKCVVHSFLEFPQWIHISLVIWTLTVQLLLCPGGEHGARVREPWRTCVQPLSRSTQFHFAQDPLNGVAGFVPPRPRSKHTNAQVPLELLSVAHRRGPGWPQLLVAILGYLQVKSCPIACDQSTSSSLYLHTKKAACGQLTLFWLVSPISICLFSMHQHHASQPHTLDIWARSFSALGLLINHRPGSRNPGLCQ